MSYTYQGKQPRYKKTYCTILGWLPFLSYSICKVDKITLINECTHFEKSLLGTNQARLSSIFINDLELLLITGLDLDIPIYLYVIMNSSAVPACLTWERKRWLWQFFVYQNV